MDRKPLVSVITPCHNAGSFISDTIESVLNQTFSDWEMLIVDDGSTDNSAEIISGYAANDTRIKLLQTGKASGSPSLPRNIGIENAKGKYIAFLDADDMWLPKKLEEQVAFAEQNDYRFVISDYEKIDEDGKRTDRVIKMRHKSSFWDVIESCSIPCLTALLSRELIDNTRFVNEPKEDFIFWLEILKKNIIAYNTGKVHALYRVAKDSRSSNKFKMISQQWYVLRNIQWVKKPVAIYFMIIFLVKGLFKFIK